MFQRYGAGEQIIDRKSPSSDMCCVVRGAVRVVIHAPGGRDLSLRAIACAWLAGAVPTARLARGFGANSHRAT